MRAARDGLTWANNDVHLLTLCHSSGMPRLPALDVRWKATSLTLLSSATAANNKYDMI